MMANALCFLVVLAAMQGARAVEYTFTNNALSTTGGMIYRDQIGEDYTKQTMDSATQFIWGVFRENNDPADRKDVPKVSVLVMDDVVVSGQSVPAATYGGNEIRVSAKYVENYGGGDVKTEISGVLYHEMTHVWQWFGNGQAPTGLTEGIADFVRLKANYAPNHWRKPGEGQNWDQGYDVTAHFLDYCDGLKSGFVADLNKLMRNGYDVQFFNQLLGKSVDQLWRDYKAMYGNIP